MHTPLSTLSTRHALAALFIGLSASIGFAAERPAEPVSEQAMKQKEIDRIKAEAEWATKSADNFKSLIETGSPEVSSAAQEAAKALQAKAAANNKFAAALEGTDEKAMREARDEAHKAGDFSRRQGDRLDIRKNLARYTSWEPMFAAAAEADKPLVDSLKAAIAKANIAGNTLFAAVNDPTKPAIEMDSRDNWIEATDNVDIAQRALGYANDRARMTAKLDFSDPEIKAKLAAVVKTEEEAIAAYRLAKEKNRAQMLLDRKRNAQIRELLTPKPVEKPAGK